jgi:AraC-like DNA-binding protein
MPRPSQHLAMPFGNATATEFTDESSCGEFLARLPDAPSRFGRLGNAEPFRIRLKNVPLPSVSLLAGVQTPKATDHWSRRVTLVIPFGRCETVLRAGREEFRWAAPHEAFFIPAGERVEAESTSGAFLRLDVVEQALLRTAAGMAGLVDFKAVQLNLQRARSVALQVRGMNWLPVIQAHCAAVDSFDCDAAALTAAGQDDAVLRTVVMMLRPDLFFAPTWASPAVRGFDLNSLLEQIEANLDGRVTLAELEVWSGRTARAIQLAFQKRFGIGPMQWVRERRLERVRERLLAAEPGATVRQIAAACGMPRMATLVPEYTRRFGELPSETLRRRG